jgi:hypothetical protein
MGKKSATILVFIALVGVCTIILVAWWALIDNAPNERITSENSWRIELGMSEPEVESILGKPADRQYHPWDVSVRLASRPGEHPEWEKIWESDNGSIIVHFDAQGRVSNRAYSVPWKD